MKLERIIRQTSRALALSMVAAPSIAQATALEHLCVDTLCLRTAAETQWQPVVHFASNAYFMWSLAAPLFALPCSMRFAFLAIVFALGSMVLIRREVEQRSWLFSIAFGFSAAAVILWLFGFDAVVWHALALLPWLLVLLERIQDRLGLVSVFLLCVAGLGSAALALQLSIVTVGVALFVSYRTLATLTPRIRILVIGILLSPSIFALLSAPVPVLRKLPSGAHFVPDYMTTVLAGPRFGPEPPIGLINRAYEGLAFYPLALVALLCLGLTLFPRFRGSVFWRGTLVTGLVLNSILLLDSVLLPVDLVQVMPLQTLRRVIPGMAYLPLAGVLSALAIGISLFSLAAAGARVLPVFALIGLCTVGALNLGQPVRDIRDLKPVRELAVKGLSQELLFSPSYMVLRTFGVWPLIPGKAGFVVKPFLPAGGLRLSASHRSFELKHIGDGDVQTRWSAQRGYQLGDEWLQIELEQPTELDGIKLNAGAFFTDYPRGIEVSVYNGRCVAGGSSAYQRILSIPAWQGSLAYSEHQDLYFEPAHNTEMVFPGAITATCILLRLISKHGQHDWSVDEVILLKRTAGEP